MARGGSAPMVRVARAGDAERTPDEAGASARQETDESAELAAAAQAAAHGPEVHALAREIARRLSVRRPLASKDARRSQGQLISQPYRGSSDEVDLEATLEALIERGVLAGEDVVVREPKRSRRAVVLLVDVSGSIKRQRLRVAAATVGALAAELARESLSVIAFWSDAAILLPLGETVSVHELVQRLLRIPAQGLTNIAFPIEVAAEQLASCTAQDQRVILLSDCVHNAGPDPRLAAARLPRLDVLLELGGESDLDLARELARAGRGRLRRISSERDVAPALTAVFQR
jgi:Mg-chelatase subunit ChlD